MGPDSDSPQEPSKDIGTGDYPFHIPGPDQYDIVIDHVVIRMFCRRFQALNNLAQSKACVRYHNRTVTK